MKRYVCTVAAGLLLALVGTSSAAAGLPLPGNIQEGTQSTTFGDQTVGEQKNEADVTQAQGNGNVNFSPAIAIFGDASTENAQGNGNTARTDVDQSNTANQSQDSTQSQQLEQGSKGSKGRCCGGQSQTGEQTTEFGDQTVGEQKNEADVDQYQGNGNVNISPAIALFGDASTKNAQGNGNTAVANVDQDNTATQSQSSSQRQSLDQGGSRGCGCGGQSQTGAQDATFGDQTVGEQKNDADVTQAQGNGNINISPALAIGGDASTRNAQGNGNTARADVDQSNTADQSQDSTQSQRLEQNGSGGQSQTGEQTTEFGDQTVGEQKNEADVDQFQGNGNFNFSPAIGIGGGHDSCRSTCNGSWTPSGGGASTSNAQGNGNSARANVGQSNQATQSQSATQRQNLGQSGGGCCKPPENGCKPAPHGDLRSNSAPCAKPPTRCPTPNNGEFNAHSEPTSCSSPNKPDGGRVACCGGGAQSGSQSTHFGDQTVGEQKNEADVDQYQGNKNANVSPAFGIGGTRDSCGCRSSYWKPDRGGASTWNAQGNGNSAWADVDQGNTVDQSQESEQHQGLVQGGHGTNKGVALS